jgi:hypothetical protein
VGGHLHADVRRIPDPAGIGVRPAMPLYGGVG